MKTTVRIHLTTIIFAKTNKARDMTCFADYDMEQEEHSYTICWRTYLFIHYGNYYDGS